jgi:hypothetical protein
MALTKSAAKTIAYTTPIRKRLIPHVASDAGKKNAKFIPYIPKIPTIIMNPRTVVPPLTGYEIKK